MQIIGRKTKTLNGAVALAIGVFDGVHRGHQKLIRTLNGFAAGDGCKTLVFTFNNHPEEIIFGQAPSSLDTSDEKAEKLSILGIDTVKSVPFTRDMMSMPPRDFILSLMQEFKVKHIVVGYDFSFGDHGEGHALQLEAYGNEFGFSAHVIPPVLSGDAAISSSRIRALVSEGRIEEANMLLGWKYIISGSIRRGRQIGMKIGYPTANLKYDPEKAIPAKGVYLTVAELGGKLFPSLTNIGSNPTVTDSSKVNIETHILDFSGNTYGQMMKVFLLKRLREEIRFDSKEALAAQIGSDAARARRFFSRYIPGNMSQPDVYKD
jgi:riboflavin kinase / FMN adenylyltransferase